MTGQAGMTAYHLASRHFGKVKILDLWSLTDRQVLDCLPRGTVSAGRYGTFISTERPLREHEQITRRCGLPLPDIVYNAVLDDDLLPLFAQLGYVVVYHQVGRIKNSEGQKFFPGNEEADGYVAVKRELALAAACSRSRSGTGISIRRSSPPLPPHAGGDSKGMSVGLARQPEIP